MFSGHLKVLGKVALITGASQGLGLELARKLYTQGCSVILVARRKTVIDHHAETMATSHHHHGDGPPPFIKAMACDVSDYHQCVTLWQQLHDEGHDPDFLFNCVGGSICKLFGDLTGEELSQGITTNYNATLFPIHTNFKLVMHHHGLEDRKSFKPRHIIIFLSVAAVYPLIGYSQYAPLKSALMALSLTLRQELSPFNYRVSCVFPGNFASEGFIEEERTKPLITKKIEGSSVAISVSDCADKILSALDHGYDVAYTDLIGWVLGSASLGAYPRYLSVLQVMISFIFLIIAPFISIFIDKDIEDSFKPKDNDTKKTD